MGWPGHGLALWGRCPSPSASAPQLTRTKGPSRRLEAAWIARILGDPQACVFIDVRSFGNRLDQAWADAVAKGMPVETQTIQGRRVYGTLSCRR